MLHRSKRPLSLNLAVLEFETDYLGKELDCVIAHTTLLAEHRPGGKSGLRVLRLRRAAQGGSRGLPGPLPEHIRGGGVHRGEHQGAYTYR